MPNYSTGRRSGRGAFTIPEMLAVVAIMVILISMLLPALGQSRETARNAVCKSQQRQIGLAFINFATDHQNTLPGCYLPPYSGPVEPMQSWMGKEAWFGVNYYGAVTKYLHGPEAAAELYRCPSLPTGVLGSGIGSNGYFDYTGLLVFTGAKKYNMPTDATWQDPQTSAINDAPTPLVVEEDPANYVNLCCIDPGHANVDRTGTWHFGGGNYIALDGHSERLKPDGPLGPTTHQWLAQAPSGAMVSLTSHPSGFGGWNKR